MRLIPLLSLCLLFSSAWALDNQLANNPSPYLAMHGGDPVQWQAWGPEVLEKARREDKLLLISSGYFSCHWCHVMQAESFKDNAVAEVLNRHFIPVKIDRELQPALDAHLIDFLERTQGQAGWPLNVFITPEGYPLVGLTYAPRDNFLDLLNQLQALWVEKREQTRDLAKRAHLELQRQRTRAGTVQTPSADALRQALLVETYSVANEMEGGFGDQSRFPMAPQLLALLEIQQRWPDQRLADFLDLTLRQMAREGLRDHLGGGFFRYTVDPSWQVPHYEKMLYTQAQLARVYLRAAALFGNPEYVEVARDTLEFVLREMAGREGGFIASLSAVDGAGREGGYYLFTPVELKTLLGDADAGLAMRHWRMTGVPATEGGFLPLSGADATVLAGPGGDVAAMAQHLASIRQRLLRAREQRGLPEDHKQLAGWNGLLLSALAEAGATLDEPRYVRAAQRLRDFLVEGLWRDGKLFRASHQGKPIGRASVADYAYVAEGLDAWSRLPGGKADESLVKELLRAAWRHFHGTDGWRADDDGLLPGMAVTAAMLDDNLPSPTAILLRLSAVSGDAQLKEKAAAASEAGAAEAVQSPFWYSGHALLVLTHQR